VAVLSKVPPTPRSVVVFANRGWGLSGLPKRLRHQERRRWDFQFRFEGKNRSLLLSGHA